MPDAEAGWGQEAFSSRRTIQAIRPREPARAISRATVIAGIRGGGILADHGASPAPQQPMEQECALLFVYGTLKRGLANHHQLGGAVFAGDAVIDGVELHDLGPFPMAIAGEGSVHGELYRVEGDHLARLDRFEGVPRLYRRECRQLADGRQAWVYLGRPRQVRHSPRLSAGRWPADSAPPSTTAQQHRFQRADSCRRVQAPGLVKSLARNQAACPAPPLRSFLARGWRPLALLAVLIGPLPPLGLQAVRAEASLALCQRWQRSSNLERIQLGNAVGTAAYLTKVHPFAESDPEHPQLLYAPADLQRACDGWG